MTRQEQDKNTVKLSRWLTLVTTAVLAVALGLTAAFTVRDSRTEIKSVTGIGGPSPSPQTVQQQCQAALAAEVQLDIRTSVVSPTPGQCRALSKAQLLHASMTVVCALPAAQQAAMAAVVSPSAPASVASLQALCAKDGE